MTAEEGWRENPQLQPQLEPVVNQPLHEAPGGDVPGDQPPPPTHVEQPPGDG